MDPRTAFAVSSAPAMRTLTLLPLVVLVACNPLAFEPAGPDAAPDPSKMGPYAVGVKTVVIRDPNRSFEDQDSRPLVTEIWYPAAESARGGQGTSYDIKSVLTEEQRKSIEEFDIPLLETSAVRDAPIFEGKEKFPLVVFSHGQGGVRWQSTFYTVPLASHGYIVVSTDHPGNTLDYLVRDGLTIPLEGIIDRPLDSIALIDHFTEEEAPLPEDQRFLSGRIDKKEIGVTGHSFGAITSFGTAVLDDRVKVIVPQAPGFTTAAFFQGRVDALDIPVLMQFSKLDKTLPYEENLPDTVARVTGPSIQFALNTGGHFSYSDLCGFDLLAIAPSLGFADVGDVIGDGCGGEAPPASISFPLINQFAIGFFNATLRHSPKSLDYLTQAKADEKASGVVDVVLDLKELK